MVVRATRVVGRLLVFFGLLLSIVAPAAADTVPLQINFQGHLRDTAGFLFSGNRNVTFRIYSSLTGGPPLWSEVQAGVSLQGGLFSVLLGSVTPIPPSTFNGSTRYLGIEIAGDTGEMSPRVALVSVPYAYHSHEADTALRADSALNASLLAGQSPAFYLNSANFIGSAWATLTGGANADVLHSHAGGRTFTRPQGRHNSTVSYVAPMIAVSFGSPFVTSTDPAISVINDDRVSTPGQGFSMAFAATGSGTLASQGEFMILDTP